MFPISDHFDGKKFRNPSGAITKGFVDLLKWQLAGGKKPWPSAVANTAVPRIAPRVPLGQLHVTFVNHATFLWQFPSLNVLTDPVYSQRLSPVSFLGPKRVRPPGLAFENLPPIDLVLVSHNHYDHLDIETLAKLESKFHPAFVVPLGNGQYLERRGIKNVTELDWWESPMIEAGGRGVSVQLVPAQHWSARGFFDRNDALWGGFVLSAGGLRAYFAGDSGYGPHFKAIAERVGTIDVACLPIGAYEPRWFMREQHMNPDDAVLAHLDLRPRRSLAFHYGTFRLTDEGIDDPVNELRAALAARGVPTADFLALETGETTLIASAMP